MRRIPVSDVPRATAPLDELPPKQAIEKQLHQDIESCSDYRGTIVPAPFHGLIAAIHEAFVGHRPLRLTPDMIWLTVVQGVAHHVRANADALRSRFTKRDERAKIVFRRDDFVKGTPENPWEEVFDAFTAGLRSEIGDESHDLLMASFSTTGHIERAANQVALLDAMSAYFDYELYTFCGIPEVLLDGTPADWAALEERVARLGPALDLEWWCSRVAPHLRQIAASAAGGEAKAFWESLYKWKSSSGGDVITGWILDFFPYLAVPEEAAPSLRNDFQPSKSTVDLPSGLSVVPFTWTLSDGSFEMQFIAGFLGISQDRSTMAVAPRIGWIVRQDERRKLPLGIVWAERAGGGHAVRMVIPGYEAFRAGIRPGDVMVRFEEHGQKLVYCEVDRNGERISTLAAKA